MYNEKHQCIDPEDASTGIKYALTINPNDGNQSFTKQYSKRVSDFVENSYRNISHFFHGSGIIWLLKLEVSKGGRLHYHGWLTFTSQESIRNFYIGIIPKLKYYCTYCLKSISDSYDSKKYKSWKEYVMKQDLLHIWLSSNKPLPIDKKKIDISKYFNIA